MLAKISLGLALLILALVGVIAIQPSTYRVVRTATIPAPPEVVFPKVSDFHQWPAWSPWQKLDPHMKQSYSGPTNGAGAIYHWSGVGKAGEGQMTMLESRPNELIRIKLDFIKPFASTCTTEFSFKPHGKETEVTWSLYGKNDFLRKAASLFVNLDQVVGPDFEKGLGQMKAAMQGTPPPKDS